MKVKQSMRKLRRADFAGLEVTYIGYDKQHDEWLGADRSAPSHSSCSKLIAPKAKAVRKAPLWRFKRGSWAKGRRGDQGSQV